MRAVFYSAGKNEAFPLLVCLIHTYFALENTLKRHLGVRHLLLHVTQPTTARQGSVCVCMASANYISH